MAGDVPHSCVNPKDRVYTQCRKMIFDTRGKGGKGGRGEGIPNPELNTAQIVNLYLQIPYDELNIPS